MKTIKIQKDRNITDGIHVIVNGEKHLLRYQSLTPQPLTVQVADDKPFEVKVKRHFAGSPVYIYEPKDNMLLQISGNPRQGISYGLMNAAMILVMATGWFLKGGFLQYISVTLWMFTVIIFFNIMRKKSFIVREVNIEKNDK
jgi:hypothetical protein